MNTEDTEKEVSVTLPGGFGGRAKGYRLMDIATVLLAVCFMYGAIEIRAHASDSEKQGAAIVKAITEANVPVVKAIERLADEQRQSNVEQKRITATMKEIACLNDPAMRNRPDARDVCKRLTRDGF